MLILKAIGIWFLFMVAAIANGALRNALLTPRLGDLVAHQISTISGSALILLITLALIPTLGITSTRGLLGIGLLWLIMTLAFEFLAGHYLFKAPWSKLLADYNLRRGRIWPLVLLTTLLAPLIAARLRGLWPPGTGQP